jgi:hypothetical protein
MEIFKGNRQFFILKALNFLSSRFFSFTVSIGKKGSINPFLGFLDFPDKNIEMP